MTITEEYFIACTNGDLDTVKRIINTRSLNNIDIRSPEGWTGLIISCFNERYEIVKFLIANNANINAINTKGTSVLMYAKTPVQQNQNDTKILKLIIDAGADINHLDSFNKSTLDYVMDNGAYKLGKWLISKGAKYGKNIKQNK
tara:strand:+ start:173 stop:604 length:432 start_codon:yes stop_codon:yes gene_type:complete